jgi:pimeloyl-ACP methyl ester carboxylesterase
VLLSLVSTLVCAGADYAREKKWADEIVPGIVVGDPVYLELKQGHKFLTLFTPAKDAKKALVIVHGLGIHPDWGLIGTLRTQLADQGYTTLSLQMPVLANDATGDQYVPTFPEAAERILVAVEFLQAKGYQKIAIVSHSLGSRMSKVYVLKNQSKLAAWASLGIGGGETYDGVKIPVLDLYGENDLPPVLKGAAARAKSLQGNAGAKQVKVPKADHFYNNHEAEMVQAVKDFLGAVK